MMNYNDSEAAQVLANGHATVDQRKEALAVRFANSAWSDNVQLASLVFQYTDAHGCGAAYWKREYDEAMGRIENVERRLTVVQDQLDDAQKRLSETAKQLDAANEQGIQYLGKLDSSKSLVRNIKGNVREWVIEHADDVNDEHLMELCEAVGIDATREVEVEKTISIKATVPLWMEDDSIQDALSIDGVSSGDDNVEVNDYEVEDVDVSDDY